MTPGLLPKALLERFAGLHDNDRRIAKGAILTAGFVLAAKLGVAFREIVIAWKYGVGPVVDAYQLALTITTWIPFLISGIATGLLVPPLVRAARQPETSQMLIAEFNGVMIVVAAMTLVVTLVGSGMAVNLLGGDLSPQVKALAHDFTLAMLPIAFLTVLIGYFNVRLQAREHHVFSVTEIAPSLLVAILIAVAPAEWRSAPLVWGSVFGIGLQVLWLGWMTRRLPEGFGRIVFRRTHPEWRPLYSSLLILGAGQILSTITIPLDQAFAAHLGEGAVATYGYANRVLGLITTFGTVVIARALLPVLSGAVADENRRGGVAQARFWGLLCLILGMVSALVGWVVAPTAISLLFQRGAFTGDNAASVAQVLRYGLTQLPFYFGGLAIIQWFAAARRYEVILAAAAAGLVSKVILNFALYERLGLPGLSLATAGMYASSFLLMHISLRVQARTLGKTRDQ